MFHLTQVPEKDKLIRQRRMGDDGGTIADAWDVPPPHRRLFKPR